MTKWLVALAWLAAAGAAGSAELKPAGGVPAPALALKTLDGATHDLARYRGKVVLVNFWATWCEPCRDEMPSIQRLRERFADQPFAVLAVNVDEPASRVQAFVEKTKVDLTVVLDPGKSVTKAWNARILPASYLIGRDGRVRYSVVGEINWDDERVVRQVGDLIRR